VFGAQMPDDGRAGPQADQFRVYGFATNGNPICNAPTAITTLSAVRYLHLENGADVRSSPSARQVSTRLIALAKKRFLRMIPIPSKNETGSYCQK